MGPFEVLDFAGVDVFYLVCQAMQDRGVPVEISETHEELIDAERYGMKSGAGFYEYPDAGAYARVNVSSERRYDYDPYPMIASAVNAAAWLLENDVATRDDIDEAMEVGMSWPRGLLAIADEYGIDRIVETLERLYKKTGWDQYDPNPLLAEMVEENRLGIETGEGFYEYQAESETFGPVEYERHDYYAVITLSRPGKLNVLDEAAWRGLRDALSRAEEDDGVRGTVVRGAGGAFCAGDDIAEMAGWETVEEGEAFFEEVALPTIEAFRTHPKPTVALVDGVATGMGCELAVLSDMAVAADGSQFAQPEAQIGALSPLWLTHGVTAVGKKKILELAMTGTHLSATEAEEIGLVNYCVSADQARDVARELIRSTTASAPGSIASIKDIWHRMEDDLVAAWFEYAIDELTERVQSDEGIHGLSAFLDDSMPRWEL
jgi:enoyl-CoA hydratase/3-hydroxyacyl-CoA dehydrogenase